MTRDELDRRRAGCGCSSANRSGRRRRRQDQRRLQSALAERRTKSQEFFSSSAGQWDRLRDELFGDRFSLAALAACSTTGWVVGDLGCGTGQVERRARAVRRARDRGRRSAAMLQAAKRRLPGLRNVELRRGELEALPIDDGRLERRR